MAVGGIGVDVACGVGGDVGSGVDVACAVAPCVAAGVEVGWTGTGVSVGEASGMAVAVKVARAVSVGVMALREAGVVAGVGLIKK